MIANPPIFKLAPGEQQLVRFASRSGPPRDVEAAYRAVFSEVLPKDRLLDRAWELARELAKRYKAMYARIAPQVEALAEQIATGELSVAEVKKLKALAATAKCTA